MGSYATFANRLPDPYYKRDRHGSGSETGSGDAGPGFSSVKLRSDQKMMVTRTNSQRIIARAVAGQKWNIDLKYHKMTQEEFDPIYSFLLQQRGPLNSFFVSLPQYRTVGNSAWQTIITGVTNNVANYTFPTAGAVPAGKSSLIVNVTNANGIAAYSSSATNIPKPGELITINDSTNTNHTKAYMITMVETHSNYHTATGQPATNAIKITVNPPLVKAVPQAAVVVFDKPLIKVIEPNANRDYTLNSDNLYSISLKLEEAL